MWVTSISLVGPTSAVSSFYGRSGATELLTTDDINVRNIDREPTMVAISAINLRSINNPR